MATWSAQGTVLQVDISSTLTTIPQVVSFNFPGINRQFEDTTHLGSTGNFKEYQGIMNDTDEVSADIFWDPTNATHDYLMDQAVLATAATDTWAAIASDSGNAKMDFDGIISQFKPTAGQNSSLKVTLGIRVTGALTYTA